MSFENLTPDLRSENDRLRAERDRAISLAQQTVRQVQAVLDSLQAPPVKAAAE